MQMMTSNFTDLINGLLHIDNLDIYVTGSNSKFLSSDILTEFRGRGDKIRVQPLSFEEFRTAYDNTNDAWKDFYTYGGLPLILTRKTDDELDILVDIVASTTGSLTKLNHFFKKIVVVKDDIKPRTDEQGIVT